MQASKRRIDFASAAVLTALALIAPPRPVLAQDASSPKASPPWETLAQCADMDGDDDKLSCFMESMRAAGYRPRPAAVAASRRHRFGLDSIVGTRRKTPAVAQQATPNPSGPDAQAGAEATDDRVSVTLDLVTLTPTDGRLVVTTTDGAIWEQTDPGKVAPLPKSGQEMVIRRAPLGGYFCKFGKWNAVRCVRRR